MPPPGSQIITVGPLQFWASFKMWILKLSAWIYLHICSLLPCYHIQGVYSFFASTLPFKHSSARISCFSGCSSPYWSYTQCSLTCNFLCPSPTNECIIFTNASRLDHLAPALLISPLNPPDFFNCSSVYNSRSKS